MHNVGPGVRGQESGEGAALRAGLFQEVDPHEVRHISPAPGPQPLTPELLRFTTAGSVDDGKSTLIGRLLYDSKGVYEDQVASIRKATRNQTTGGLDLSLLTDGLRAEREQGITIDVAYRYFSTARRKFIIADTPGHEQYTRNMATGASTANLAIVLIDARYGVLPQSRRHAYIASLLGIPHIVVAVNKMDLVGFSQEVFESIRRDFAAFAEQLEIRDAVYIPISALDGDNVVRTSSRTPWYEGPSLLRHLETVPIASDRNLTDFRFPVQTVIRPNLDFRGFAGQVASGIVRRGDAVTVLPSGRRSRVKEIVTWEGRLEEAFAPMSVTICLEDELDVSRGDMLVADNDPAQVGRRFQALVVWMNEKPLVARQSYLLKQTTQMVQARIREVRHRVNIDTLEREPDDRLEMNEIGLVEVETHRPVFFDAYSKNRATGSLILIDPLSNETIAAGMIVSAVAGVSGHGRVTAAERRARFGHKPAILVIEDEPLAYAAERFLFDRGCHVHVLEDSSNESVIREMTAAGAILIVRRPSGSELESVPVLRPSPHSSQEQIWRDLVAANQGEADTNLGGEGI
jgi:sulfate adenylyltransferase large subunit